MKRRIIQTAQNTLMITLPRSWVKKYNLEKSQELEVIENGSHLVASPTSSNTILRAHLDLTGDHKNIVWKKLAAIYIKGCDEVTIVYDNKDTLEEVQDFMRDLLGWGVAAHTENTILIKNILPTELKELNETINRIFFLLLEMGDYTIKNLEIKNYEALKNLSHMDFNLDKLVNLVLRLLNRNGFRDYTKINSLYKLIAHLEEIGDEFRRIGKLFVSKNIKTNSELLNSVKETNKLVKDLKNFFYEFSEKKALEFFDYYKDIEKPDILETKISDLNALVYGHLSTIRHLVKAIYEEILVLKLGEVENGC